jgi:hypothetical protein
MKLIFALVLISASSLFAQTGAMKVDTITSGNGNEYHPAISRTRSPSRAYPGEWLVFERQTDDSSFIVAKMIQNATARWDTSEVIISRSPLDELQSRPDIGLNASFSGHGGLIAWQKRTAGKWAIFYSAFSPQTLKWSPPLPLTNDTLDDVNVRLQPVGRDSQFLAAWQSGNAIRVRIHPSVPAYGSDTLAVSNFDSSQFDIVTDASMGEGGLLYTIKKTDTVTVVRIGFTTSPTLSVITRDTLKAGVSVADPRFAQASSIYEIVFESQDMNAPQRNICGASLGYFNTTRYEQLTETNDSLSYRNACLYHFPVTTQNISTQQSIGRTEAIVAERYTTADTVRNTSIVILQGERTTSIASAGYNRNSAIGGIAYYLDRWYGGAIPIVWESNRSGKNHLYGMAYVSQYSLGVEADKSLLPQFALMQNYPNPFNPSTTIAFSIPTRSQVTLKIFDVMGREVSVIVSDVLPAGTYQRQWIASGMPSGIYFYRLQAGTYCQTRKLLLIR